MDSITSLSSDEKGLHHLQQELGVSVHWMSTGLINEIRAMGKDETSACIHDLEDLSQESELGIARRKGPHVVSPVDNKTGASYVHCLYLGNNQERRHVGTAKYILSYSWAYKYSDIVGALQGFCKSHNLNPYETYIWMDLLCINQHRVVEAKCKGETGLLNFEDTFPSLIGGIGHMLAMMTPWNNPLYLTRIWCIFELYVAHELESCDLTVIIPSNEKISLHNNLFGQRGDLDILYETFGRTKVQKAEATFPRDRDMILGMIKDYTTLNNQVNALLRSWIRGTINEIIEDRLLPGLRAKEEHERHIVNDEESANLMIQYGEFLFRNGELDEAMKWSYRGLNACIELYGETHEKVAKCYTAIGNVKLRNSDIDGALTEHRKALEIRKLPTAGASRVSLAESYNHIGHALYGKSDFMGALTECNKALEIYKSELGRNDLVTASAYIIVGISYEALMRLDEASTEYHKALVIRQRVLAVEEHPTIAYNYNCIGSVLKKQSSYLQALENHKMSLAIYESVFGGEHPDTAYTLHSIGSVLLFQGKHEEALKTLRNSLEIYQSVFGKQHDETSNCHRSIGRVLIQLGNYDEALDELHKALHMVAAFGGQWTASTNYWIGEVLFYKGDYKDSLSYYEKTRDFNKSAFGSDHPHTINTYARVAKVEKILSAMT